MPYQNGSNRISNQKPVNIFYVWYTELCRRLNSSPASVVKPAKPKCQTVLDFVADRLKVEEWSPVINALKHDNSLHVVAIKSKIGANCEFLHEVDTEDKARKMKRRYGTLCTAFILRSLLKSVSCLVKNTDVLTCLEFDGLPMFHQYLEPLLKALKKNKTVKCLSLSRCSISDVGCEMVCAYVRVTPNIEVLNLSGCGLTGQSGEYIANLIKYQQINRYCETWHNSLRYADPDIHVMKGIKRITLNGNPVFGDDGLGFILTQLEDDLWIKALDMQKCGITENISLQILKVVRESQALEIVDFRLNDQLSVATLEKILNILRMRQGGKKSEFQWCSTTFTLTGDSFMETTSNYLTTGRSTLHKTKSVPLKQNFSKMTVNDRVVRRTKTADNVTNKTQVQNGKSCLGDIQKQVMVLSCQLQEEIARRKETEKMNEELKRQLEQIVSVTSFQAHQQSQESFKTLMNAIDNYASKQNGTVIAHTDNVVNGECVNILTKICSKTQNGLSSKNGYQRCTAASQYKNGVSNNSNGYHHNNSAPNGSKNGFSFSLNGAAAACTILEKLVSGGRDKDNVSNVEDLNKDSDEDSLLSYMQPERERGSNASRNATCSDGGVVATFSREDASDMTASQISLFKFMENLKSSNGTTNLPVNFNNVRSSKNTSKYIIADKQRDKVV